MELAFINTHNMKYSWTQFLFLFHIFFSVYAQKAEVRIPAESEIAVSYLELFGAVSEPKTYSLELRVRSTNGIYVRMIDRETGESRGSFGLASRGKTTIAMGKDKQLLLSNQSSEEVRLAVERTFKTANSSSNTVTQAFDLILENTTDQSIPLRIPGIMNPNLSPYSKSGVRLPMGQEIFLKKGMKQRLIFRVDANIQDGMTIDIAKRIKEAKD